MKGSYNLDFKSCGFFKNSLNVCAEFPYDSKIVAASLASPAFWIIIVICTKFSESVCAEQNFVC